MRHVAFASTTLTSHPPKRRCQKQPCLLSPVSALPPWAATIRPHTQAPPTHMLSDDRTSLAVTIKHAGQSHPLQVDLSQPATEFKNAIYGATGVPVDRFVPFVTRSGLDLKGEEGGTRKVGRGRERERSGFHLISIKASLLFKGAVLLTY
jgi:hypothetical protein